MKSIKENFKFLSDQELLNQTAKAAAVEKAATLALLEHLSEVDERRAHAILSFSSLFDYVTRGLGYSESQASERVNAVRLMRQNSGVREHLDSGALTVTAAAQIQRFVVAEKKYAEGFPARKRSLLIEACLNQSKRSVEKILFLHSSAPVKAARQESVRAVSADLSEIKFLASEEQIETLNRARELFPDDSLADLMKRALKLLISEKERQLGKQGDRNPSERPAAENTVATATANTAPPATSPQTAPPATLPAVQPNKSGIANPKLNSAGNGAHRQPNRSHKQLQSRHIPRPFKQIIYARSGGQCEFVSRITGERCRSRSRLQIDHIRPMAFGGKTEPGNLRYLCANHNLQRTGKRSKA